MFSLLWAEFGQYILLLGTALLAIIGYGAQQRYKGGQAAKQKQKAADRKARQKAQQVERDVDAMSNDAVKKELADRWDG